MRVSEFVAFIKERDRIRFRKEEGEPRPWTKNPILDTYRFCNVRREDDRVTRWLRAEFYPYFDGNADIWFAAVVARLLNLPESLSAARRAILPWKPELLRGILHDRVTLGGNNFNAAYIVSTNGRAMDKVDYLVAHVLGPMWAARKGLRLYDGLSLHFYHALLMAHDGMGSFMAAQVVADLKYMEPLKRAHDWHTWAASGPGSRRGLNRVVDNPVDGSWREKDWLATLQVLRDATNAKLGWVEPLHAQDIQNCLCEFDKYERARLGEGRPKQIYKER